MKFQESQLAHEYLDGLEGIEIGGSAHNPFGLNTKNVDITSSTKTVYKKEEREMCGSELKVDIIASGDNLPLKSESVDFVISSHVIEHFYDPIKALKEWYRVVKDNGYIYIIVPHKERTFDKDRPRTKLKELINRHKNKDGSEKETADPGLSNDYSREDRTDMHFSVWITEDFVELIEYLGWKILDVQDVDDKVGNGFTVVIQKRKKKNVFLYSTMPTSGCYYYRGDVFLRHSKNFNVSSNIDFENGKIRSNKYIAQHLKNADIVIFLRPKNVTHLALVKIFRMEGKLVFIDNDDDFSTIDKNNPAFSLVGSKSETNTIFLQIADGAIGTTDKLVEKMKKKNKNTLKVSNFIDFKELITYYKKGNKEKKKIRIAITGSAATLENTSYFVNILKKIQKKHNNIEFVFFSDKNSLEILKKEFYDNSIFIEEVPFQEYSEVLSSLNLDIALIPRKDNEFNRYKSNCKYLELATLNIAVIAQGFSTKDGPYDNIIQNKINGIIAYNEHEWLDGIEYLLNKKNREKVIKNAHRFVKENFDIRKNINLWDKAVKKLINNSDNRKFVKGFSIQYYINTMEAVNCDKNNKVIKEKELHIQKRNKWLTEKNEQIQERNKWLTEKNEQIQERNKIIKQKEQENIKLKNSKTFQVGDLFFRSIKKPYKLITFPINLVKILKK